MGLLQTLTTTDYLLRPLAISLTSPGSASLITSCTCVSHEASLCKIVSTPDRIRNISRISTLNNWKERAVCVKHTHEMWSSMVNLSLVLKILKLNYTD